MIANAPLTDNITRIDLGVEPASIRDSIRDEIYTEQKTYGFQIAEEGPQFLSASLITSTPTIYQFFDPEANEFREETISESSSVPFRIDFQREFLEVFSNNEDSGDVINRIGQISEGFSTYNTTFDLRRLFKELIDTEYLSGIDSIRIDNYSPVENAQGNCYLKTFDDDTAHRLIEEFEDISYLGVRMSLQQEEITIGFYNSGSLRIYSGTDEAEEILEIIKDLISSSLGVI